MRELFIVFAAVFVVHFFVFAFMGLRRGERRNFLLAGTFAFLSVLYGLKATRPATPTAWLILLRGGAILCTGSYLVLSSRRPGTWVHRLKKKMCGSASPLI